MVSSSTIHITITLLLLTLRLSIEEEMSGDNTYVNRQVTFLQAEMRVGNIESMKLNRVEAQMKSLKESFTVDKTFREVYNSTANISSPGELHLCSSSACGVGAQCSVADGVYVAYEEWGLGEDPVTFNYDCNQNSECFFNETCVEHKCVSCADLCGDNSECSTYKHVPTRGCPNGYEDPVMCNLDNPATDVPVFLQQNPCEPSHCELNSSCHTVMGLPVCSTLNYECFKNPDCSVGRVCVDNACVNCTVSCNQGRPLPGCSCKEETKADQSFMCNSQNQCMDNYNQTYIKQRCEYCSSICLEGSCYLFSDDSAICKCASRALLKIESIQQNDYIVGTDNFDIFWKLYDWISSCWDPNICSGTCGEVYGLYMNIGKLKLAVPNSPAYLKFHKFNLASSLVTYYFICKLVTFVLAVVLIAAVTMAVVFLLSKPGSALWNRH